MDIMLVVFSLLVGAMIGFLFFAVLAVVQAIQATNNSFNEKSIALFMKLDSLHFRLRRLEEVLISDSNSGNLPAGVYEEQVDAAGNTKLVRIDNQPDNSSGIPGGLPSGLKPAAKI